MSAAWVEVRGAGPVGLALALFLVRRGIDSRRIALEPAVAAWSQALPAPLASRVLAVSEGTCQLLERITALPAAGSIRQVEVSMLGHAGRTRINAEDVRTAALGRVMRYGDLLDTLRAAARGLQWAPTQPADQTPGSPGAQASLIVHAEGDTGDDAQTRTFDQAALLGEVHAAQAPLTLHAVAFERFTAHGPLALLPLAQPARWSLVWCDQVQASQARQRQDRSVIAQALETQIGNRLGPLRLEGPLACVTLSRRTRRIGHQTGEVWIGNAAQSLHPVAGQGLNLGMRDAFELADALALADRRGLAIDRTVQNWHAARQADRSGTIRLTDLMARSFTWPLARPVQSGVLAALDLSATLRRPLAERLMFGRRH
jgi:2-octaprenyl-6-methoxyphenol hydroxylase